MPYEDIIQIIKNNYKDDFIKLESPPSQPAINYKIKNYKGQLGFISSMSNPFCSTCNRIRLTADGNFKVCLHDEKEISLRDIIRNGGSNEDLIKGIYEALQEKKQEHIGMDELNNISKSNNPNKRPMTKIGG